MNGFDEALGKVLRTTSGKPVGVNNPVLEEIMLIMYRAGMAAQREIDAEIAEQTGWEESGMIHVNQAKAAADAIRNQDT